MPFRPREIAIGVALFLVLAGIYGWRLWQPERQVRLHHEHLIAAAENRKLKRLATFLADDYSDRWGFDRARATESADQVLRQFFTLEIKAPIETLTLTGDTATITAPIRLEGNGTAIADFAQRRIAGLTQPFTFHWRRKSWRPWDWQLERVEQPQLSLPTGFDW